MEKIEKIKLRSVDEVLEGTTLAKKLIGLDGSIIIGENTLLNEDSIKEIKKNNISFLYVYEAVEKAEGSLTEGFVHAMQNKLKEEIIEEISKITERLIKNEEYHEIIIQKVKETLDYKDVYDIVENLKIIDSYTLTHILNVTILSLAIGLDFGLEEDDLQALSIASLTYDIGKREIPGNVLSKQEELSDEERHQILMHPIKGGKILKEKGYSDKVVKAVEQHHEKYDGSGYPNHLKKDEISFLAKIIGICDTYEALVSERPYRKAFSNMESIEFVFASGDYYYNQQIVNAFLRVINILHDGIWVKLNTGENGVIIRENSEVVLRPVVCILYDKDNHRLKNPREVDLSDRINANIFVERIL